MKGKGKFVKLSSQPTESDRKQTQKIRPRVRSVRVVTRRDRIRRETDKKKQKTVTLQVWNGKQTVMYLSMARETTVYTLPRNLQYQLWLFSLVYNRPLLCKMAVSDFLCSVHLFNQGCESASLYCGSGYLYSL
jgi:hypothetical protein